jgi:hypothetical protein
MRQYIAEKIVGDQVGIDPAILAAKQPVRLFQDCRCPALGALMFDKKIDMNLLKLFPALITKPGISEILIAAGGT